MNHDDGSSTPHDGGSSTTDRAGVTDQQRTMKIAFCTSRRAFAHETPETNCTLHTKDQLHSHRSNEQTNTTTELCCTIFEEK